MPRFDCLRERVVSSGEAFRLLIGKWITAGEVDFFTAKEYADDASNVVARETSKLCFMFA